MDILLVNGFLGSGKTSVILALARRLAANNLRLALIQNEMGKTRIDEETLRETNLEVREIFDGCICCNVRAVLLQTIKDIETAVNPDLIIIEPSGVAGASELLSILSTYDGEINHHIVISLFDITRFHAILDLSSPLIAAAIDTADLLCLTKCDVGSARDAAVVRERLRLRRPDVNILQMAVPTELGIESLANWIINCMQRQCNADNKQTSDDKDGSGIHRSLADVVVAAEECELDFADKPIPSQLLQERVVNSWQLALDQLLQSNVRLIGNIKGTLAARGSGFISFGAAGNENQVSCIGSLNGNISWANLRGNLIVFGIPALEAETILKNAMESITKSE